MSLYSLCPARTVAVTLFCLVTANVPATHAQVASENEHGRRAAAIPVITVWYGNQQSFGQIGDPVPAVNILGNVFDPDGIAWLGYTLNGGDTVRLTVGPDERRLAARGDFNIDIPYPTLLAGPNRVIISALDSIGEAARETVMVNYFRGNTWPENYTIDWSAAARIEDVAQVVDGFWTLTGGGLRTVATGYDRFVAVGEGDWDDYEATVPVIIHRFDSSGYAPPSNGGGVGFALRWPGHSDSPPSLAGRQPKTGYLPFGALGWYTYAPGREELSIMGNNAVVAARDTTGRLLQMGVQYIFKMRVQTNPGLGGLYSLKVWQAGLPEPAGWDLSAQQTLADPQSGCLLLVAHHVDATFGDLAVTPITDTTVVPSTIVSDDFHTGVLNTALWTYLNPLGDGALSFSGTGTPDAWVRMSVPAGVPHQPWTDGIKAPRIMQPANNTDFEIETKFESPLTLRYQMQGVLVQQDTTRFLRFDFNSDGSMTRVFAAGFRGGTPTVRANLAIAANGASPLLMRVKRRGHQWTFSYSLNVKTWIDVATFVDTLVVTSVGPFGGNAGSPSPAHEAIADYFFNTAAPVYPEDPVSVGPVITQHPAGKTVAVGQTASFIVGASGTAPLSYQWQRNGVDVPGATGTTYTTAALTLADSGARFRCRVSNTVGSATSNAALLRVLAPPAIVQHPADQTVPSGSQATFMVEAAGSRPLEYQWQKNGVPIPGATAAAYMTPAVGPADNGSLFRCRVANEVGSVFSSAGRLTVTTNDSGRVTANLVAFYPFSEGTGSLIHDLSGAGSPLNLRIDDMEGVEWGSGFLRVESSTVISSTASATKIFNAARATNELTVEAWIRPATADQGNPPARIIGFSSHQNQRNFGLDQALSAYEFRLRTTGTNRQGQPYLRTPAGVITPVLMHIVYTRSSNGDARIYRDGGVLTSGRVEGTFANWDADYNLFLANTQQSNREWDGEFHLVAVYNRALTGAEVVRNFAAGPNPGAQENGGTLEARTGLHGQPSFTGLLGNYPNPFNPSTVIRYSLAADGQVRIAVYNILGAQVALLADGHREGGVGEVVFDASGLPSGIYFCRLAADGITQTRRLMLLK